jgi:putative sigma-54 modulation protein
MAIQISAKNMELAQGARDYAEKKLGKLDRHLPDIIETKVEIIEEKTKSPEDRYVVQVTINSNGTLLRGEERGVDLFTAIDKTAKVMDRQIERYRGKLNRKGRGFSPVRGKSESETVSPPPPARKVVKTKRFVISPMSTEEAIDQMELLGHNFFLFFNIDDKKLNVVYQRRDNNYGLIDPDIDWTPDISDEKQIAGKS